VFSCCVCVYCLPCVTRILQSVHKVSNFFTFFEHSKPTQKENHEWTRINSNQETIPIRASSIKQAQTFDFMHVSPVLHAVWQAKPML
jgi:hypothetical protein